MPIVLKGFNLVITYNCTAQCNHCIYRSGPARGGHMLADDAEQWLRQVSEHPLEWVTLFGGEPFIYLDDLAQMVRAVRRHTGAVPQVVTNGYWAFDEEQARAKLGKLQAAGLDDIGFSVDSFHCAYVPVARVALGVRMAKTLGYRRIRIDNQWIISPELDIPTNRATRRMMALLAEMVDLSGVQITSSRTHPVGRAAEHLPDLLHRAGAMPVGLCQAEGLCVAPYYLGEDLEHPYVVEIHPDGTVNLCAGIALGNVHDVRLRDLLRGYDYTNYKLVQTLKEGGPRALLAQAEALGYRGPGDYVDQCHLCYEVRAFLHEHGQAGLGPAHIYDCSPEG